MDLNKLGITLFDVLSYLLPGFVLVFTLSMVEATFSDSSLLALSSMNENWLTVSILAYFFGQFSYRLGSFLHNKWPSFFETRGQRLSRSLYCHIRKLLTDMHSIEFEEGERINSLETYLLADSYVVASNKNTERDSLMAREGFHKNSMVAFAILTIAVLATLLVDGTKFQLVPGNYLTLSIVVTMIVFTILFLMTVVFWRGFAFFNRLKINNTLLLAMTLRALDNERSVNQG